MNRRHFLKSASLFTASMTCTTFCAKKPKSAGFPNIVLIYADDLGYGDISCYGATRIETPNIDRLADEGVKFTEAYSTAATCTPSRYSLLTGEYAWRRKGTGIAPGDASLIISTDRLTLPKMLSNAGYRCGVVGKWHLGLGKGKPDWNEKIVPGPAEIGFHYGFLIPATGDRVPCVYVENQEVVGLDSADPIEVSFAEPVGDDPTGVDFREKLKVGADRQHSDTIVNGISRIGYMKGGHAARWVDEDMADVITGKAVNFINENKDIPFFLYFALHDIHVPRVPHPRFVGKTDMGPRGDVIVQADWCVGEILKKLDENGLAENTIVIFSSDNGPVLNDGYKDQAVERVGDHKPGGPLRGGKYSSFEAGTRMPFILRWPERVEPGESAALVSQVDLLASFAAMTGQQLPLTEAPDSMDILTALTGEFDKGRDHLVQEAPGVFLSLRMNQWKYIEPSEGAPYNATKDIETGREKQPQLYDVVQDVGETNNLAKQNPEIVKKAQQLLDKLRKTGDRLL
ncbi:arylsulfatase [candidate division KSB1 bacterium]|nr:arylsulfatase [candidate division KSB1 bacterium]